MLLQRALAAAGRGDLVPLVRLLYLDLVVDPETLEAIPDPSYSDGMYYGVDCQDYSYYAGTSAERAAQFLADAEEVGAENPRLGAAIFVSDLPCVTWPGAPESVAAAPTASRRGRPHDRARRHRRSDHAPRDGRACLRTARRRLPRDDARRLARHLRLRQRVPGRPRHGVPGQRDEAAATRTDHVPGRPRRPLRPPRAAQRIQLQDAPRGLRLVRAGALLSARVLLLGLRHAHADGLLGGRRLDPLRRARLGGAADAQALRAHAGLRADRHGKLGRRPRPRGAGRDRVGSLRRLVSLSSAPARR